MWAWLGGLIVDELRGRVAMVKIQVLQHSSTSEMSNTIDCIPTKQDEISDPPSTVTKGPCPVCLSRRFEEESGIDGCTHIFCYSCITEWLKVSESCPLCKAPVTEVRTPTTVDGKPRIKKLSELKAEAEAARIIAQANEVPMTLEREAVSQYIHEQRARVQQTLSDKARSRNSKTMNQMYRKETEMLTQLQSLKEEMERLPRREIMGNPRFRQVVYMKSLVWKPISRPTTSIRFNCAVACAHPNELMHRLRPFLKRELPIILLNKKNVTEGMFNKILTLIQNHEINNPTFETILLNMNLFSPWCIRSFANLLYEFCASGLELDAFDANSSYSLDPAFAPNGRLIPSLISAARNINPIVLNGDEDDDDDAIIIDRQRSDTSSSDGVAELYNHNACRLGHSASTRNDGSFTRNNVESRDNGTLQDRMNSILPSISTFPNFTFANQIPSLIRPFSLLPIRTTSKKNPEVISIEDDPAGSNEARINSIPRRDMDSSSSDPSWLNVTGESERGGYTGEWAPTTSSSHKRPCDDRNGNESRRRSRRSDEDRAIRRSYSTKEERKNRHFLGARVGSRRNCIEYYIDKLNERKMTTEDLEKMSRDLSGLSSRIEYLQNECKREIAERKRRNISSQEKAAQVINVDDDMIDIHEDEAGPSTSNTHDDSVVLVS